MNLIKQIASLLIVATAITVACYFLPFLNSLLEDYLVGFYIVAIVLPLGIRWYEAKMQMPKDGRDSRDKEWMRKSSEAITGPDCYDQRNVDRQLHIFDGFREP